MAGPAVEDVVAPGVATVEGPLGGMVPAASMVEAGRLGGTINDARAGPTDGEADETADSVFVWAVALRYCPDSEMPSHMSVSGCRILDSRPVSECGVTFLRGNDEWSYEGRIAQLGGLR